MNATGRDCQLCSPSVTLTGQEDPGGTACRTYLASLPRLTMLTPSKVVFPVLSGGVLLRAMMPVSLG